MGTLVFSVISSVSPAEEPKWTVVVQDGVAESACPSSNASKTQLLLTIRFRMSCRDKRIWMEITPRARVLAALPEDLGLFPSLHMAAYNCPNPQFQGIQCSVL